MRKCECCLFWVKGGFSDNRPGHRSGYCHRYPPTVTKSGGCAVPLVRGNHWCGEFKDKEEDACPFTEEHAREVLHAAQQLLGFMGGGDE